MSTTEAPITIPATIHEPSPRPAAPPVQLSRPLILAVTARCLHEVGYDATTIRTLAGRLGCAVGSIYRYFDDKHALLSAVTQQTLDPVVELIDSGASLERSIALYLRRAQEEPEAYRLMFWLACTAGQRESAFSGAPLPGVVVRIIESWGTRLGDAALARRCWALLHGSIMLGQTPDEVLAAVLQLLGGNAGHGQITQAAPALPVLKPMPQPPAASDESTPVTPQVVILAQPQAAPRDHHALSAASDDVCML